MPAEISVIIPARNEEQLIGSTISSVLASIERLALTSDIASTATSSVEVLVVDNQSTDKTRVIGERYARYGNIQLLHCDKLGAARARNMGAEKATGEILVFLDADTMLPADALVRIVELTEKLFYEAGITRLASLESGWASWAWWTFWEYVRCLPLARAKAMPALMFCKRTVFDEFGPFDERVAIGEEWPILAGLYRSRRQSFIYDRSLTALTSSRRMELQRFGYLRTFAKYIWAILHLSGRVNYSDRFRGLSRSHLSTREFIRKDALDKPVQP